MAVTKLVLDRQAVARVFPFGTTSSGGEALVTINNGILPTSNVVLNVLGSATLAGDMNVGGNLNITGAINNQTVNNINVSDLTITMNDGGATPADGTSGIIVEGTGNTIVAAMYYSSTSGTRWMYAIGGDAVGTTATQTLTNKSISGSQITSAVALATTVTTNANLTGPITSVGNATAVASQTGTGTTFVMQASPTLTTPVIGAATGTSLSVSGSLTTGVASSVAGDVIWRNASNAFTQTFRGSNPGAASIIYVLPLANPTAGQSLTAAAPSGGISQLSWASPAAPAYQRATVVSGTQDGANKTFTIANTLSTGSEQVYMNGQLLTPGASNDYVYNGTTTVTFQAAFAAPISTDVIRVYGTY